MKNRYEMIVGSLIILFIVFLPIVSAANNNSLVNPGMGMDWYRKQPEEFKELVWYVLGGGMFIVGAIFILLSLFGAGKAQIESTFGSEEGKNKAVWSIIKNFGILLLMIGIIILGLSVFGWF